MMDWKKGTPIIAGILVSIIGTGVLYWMDSRRVSSTQRYLALAMARQIASQADGMVLSARQDGQKDPVGWAVSYLAQGVEPRLIKVSKDGIGRRPAGVKVEPEAIVYDKKAGLFEYRKILVPEREEGIRVQLDLGYVGFLGSRSAIGNDISVVACLAALFIFAYLIVRYLVDGVSINRLRLSLHMWIEDARGTFKDLGIQIRELVKQATEILSAAMNSREAAQTLSEELRTGLKGIVEAKTSLRDVEHTAVQAEVLALNLVIESALLGNTGHRVSNMAEELHRLVQKMRKLNQVGDATVAQLEKDIRPWAEDADAVLHSFDQVFDGAHDMNGYIDQATETILRQVKLMKDLKAEHLNS